MFDKALGTYVELYFKLKMWSFTHRNKQVQKAQVENVGSWMWTHYLRVLCSMYSTNCAKDGSLLGAAYALSNASLLLFFNLKEYPGFQTWWLRSRLWRSARPVFPSPFSARSRRSWAACPTSSATTLPRFVTCPPGASRPSSRSRAWESQSSV